MGEFQDESKKDMMLGELRDIQNSLIDNSFHNIGKIQSDIQGVACFLLREPWNKDEFKEIIGDIRNKIDNLIQSISLIVQEEINMSIGGVNILVKSTRKKGNNKKYTLSLESEKKSIIEELSPQEFEFLSLLCAKVGFPQSLSDDEEKAKAKAKVHIYKLRQKVPQNFIKNIPGKGYYIGDLKIEEVLSVNIGDIFISVETFEKERGKNAYKITLRQNEIDSDAILPPKEFELFQLLCEKSENFQKLTKAQKVQLSYLKKKIPSIFIENKAGIGYKIISPVSNLTKKNVSSNEEDGGKNPILKKSFYLGDIEYKIFQKGDMNGCVFTSDAIEITQTFFLSVTELDSLCNVIDGKSTIIDGHLSNILKLHTPFSIRRNTQGSIELFLNKEVESRRKLLKSRMDTIFL